ncbi:MAG: 2-amino-4-hydroxy-6-hydroxymethyldihydropteridine diphosphokinase [Gammaproteobacteria bacterium]|nr:2-amino-4-hydroxy-6-hydroxymethyldihydropteridine diphosphokinase [Gammaproteobacteria bacterium]
MARVYLGIGSNIERERNIRGGVADLKGIFGTLTLSRVFESEPVGFSGDNFYNLVVAFDTEMPVEALSQTLHQIEAAHGRTREGPRLSSRTLDIDLLLYGDVVMREGRFELPRGEITQNAFVLWPLAEIAPDREHPLLHQRYAELWAAFDQARQPLWPVPFAWQN